MKIQRKRCITKPAPWGGVLCFPILDLLCGIIRGNRIILSHHVRHNQIILSNHVRHKNIYFLFAMSDITRYFYCTISDMTTYFHFPCRMQYLNIIWQTSIIDRQHSFPCLVVFLYFSHFKEMAGNIFRKAKSSANFLGWKFFPLNAALFLLCINDVGICINVINCETFHRRIWCYLENR